MTAVRAGASAVTPLSPTDSPLARWGLPACIFSYLLLSLPNLTIPGFHLDEGMYGLVSSYVLRPANPSEGVPVHYWWPLGDRILPVMAEHYVGPLAHYFLFPFMKVLGQTVVAVRLACVVVGLGILCAVYRSLHQLFGARPAFFTSLLLSVDVAFVHVSRLACHREEIFAVFLFWSSVFFLARFLRSRATRHLAIAGFAFGLGITLKIIFLWYVAALFGVIVIFAATKRLPAFSRKELSIVLAFLVLGMGPLIAYNLFHPLEKFRTPKLLFASLAVNSGPEAAGMDHMKYVHAGVLPARRFIELTKTRDNWNYPENLVLRARQFVDLTGGRLSFSESSGVVFSNIEKIAGGLLSLLVLLSIGGVALSPFLLRRMHSRHPAALPAVQFFYAFVFLGTAFTVRGFNPEHLLILWPFPQIAIGLFLAGLIEALSEKTAVRNWLAAALLLPAMSLHAGLNIRQDADARRNGGSGRWTTAVTDLAKYLEEKGPCAPVLFGILGKESLAYLTRETVRPLHCFGGEPAEVAAVYQEQLEFGGPRYYLWAGTDDESPESRRRFLDHAETRGDQNILEKVFMNKAQSPVYRLYRLEGPPSNK